MNVIDILKTQHQKLITLMTKIAEVDEVNSDNCDQLFQEFRREFNLHDQIEDEIVYPVLKDKSELEKKILKGYQAHHIVNVGILELRLMPYNNESWMPKFLVIRDSILSHLREEEMDVFEKANTLFLDDELNELGEVVNKQFLKKLF